jgi:hypothetical protein
MLVAQLYKSSSRIGLNPRVGKSHTSRALLVTRLRTTARRLSLVTLKREDSLKRLTMDHTSRVFSTGCEARLGECASKVHTRSNCPLDLDTKSVGPGRESLTKPQRWELFSTFSICDQSWFANKKISFPRTNQVSKKSLFQILVNQRVSESDVYQSNQKHSSTILANVEHSVGNEQPT